MGSFPEEVELAEWEVDTPAVIRSFRDRDPSALRELERLQLKPGVAVTIDRKTPRSLVLRFEASPDGVQLSRELATQVLVGR
jgi:hypothetical protein